MSTNEEFAGFEYPDIPEDRLKEIYYAMISRFPDSQEIEMARFSLAMNDAGFNCKTLGYPKMKFMLPKLGQFVSCRTNPASSVSDLLITLHRVPDWDAQAPAAEVSDCLPKSEVAADKNNDWDILPQCSFVHLSADELQKMPESFSNIRLTVAAQNSLLKYQTGVLIQGMEALLSQEKLDQLSDDYSKAREANLFRSNDHITGAYDFPTHFHSSSGDLLFITLAPSRDGDEYPWFSKFCGTLHHTSAQPEKYGPSAAEPPTELSESLVDFRPIALSAMHCYTKGLLFDSKRILKPDAEEIQALKDSYAAAKKEQHLFSISGGFAFLTSLHTPSNQLLQAEIVPEYQSGKWMLSQIRPALPYKALERFAYMGSWDYVLHQLEKKALPEHWSFGQMDDNRILHGYLRYTFYRLCCEKKVLISEDGQYAAFNTGLVDESYDDIFAVFVPQDPFNGVSWKFCTFCVASESPWGKELVKTFNPLPERAEYFTLTNASNLLYDDSCPLNLASDHIIVQRIYRWPLDVLQKNLTDETMQAALSQIEAAVDSSDEEQVQSGFKKLQELLISNSMYIRRLRECLNAAIVRARKRVRWNYQTALPSYFPTGNNTSLMMPLDLTGTGRIDFALVVDRQKNNTYIGETILTLAQAYVDARLVCRPDKDWLNNELIENALETEVDDITADIAETN